MARSSDRRPTSSPGTDEPSASRPRARLDWLADGGEMGARIRAFNWAATPLGPIERWPQSLKTTVRILLTSRQPMFLWWGERLTHLYNDAYRPLLGHRHGHALGQPASALWRELWHELEPRAEAALGRSEDAEEETLLLLPGWDGSQDEKYYLFAANVIPDDQGRPGGLLCVNSDDTPRARLLEWEQATRREAERQREYLYSLLMQAPAIIIILRGPDALIDLITPFACEVAGRRHEDLIKRPLFEVLPELARQGLGPRLARVFETGVPFVGRETPILIDRRRGHGEERLFFNFEFAALRNLEGSIDGVFVTAAEITEQVAARERMDSLRASAETANRAKDDFLAMLGHELRNPLAPILTALQLLRQRGVERSARAQAVLERQVHHLTHLVDDLLDVARISRGKVELKHTRLELAEVIARAIETAGPLIEQRGHHLAIEVPRTGLLIDGDAARLGQVVSNLLTNAAKYTEPGGHIQVIGAREDDTIRLRVRDSGVGIAPDMLPRIFDLFTRVRSSAERVHEGLGLGLAIVRNLVNLHGGTVSATSPGLGRGSEFLVELPACAPLPPLDSEERRPVALLGPGPAPPSGARVLIVDDNEDAARMLSEALEPSGYQTRVACNGAAAIRACDEFTPEIALLDLGMPIMDGFELAGLLRRRPGLEHLRLVAITGYGLQADQERSEAAGFMRHLVKPIDIDVLTSVLNALMEKES